MARKLGLEPSFYFLQLRALTVRLKLEFSSFALWLVLELCQSWLLCSPSRVMKAEIVPTLLGIDWGGQKGCCPPPVEHSLETRVFVLAECAAVQNSSVATVTTTHLAELIPCSVVAPGASHCLSAKSRLNSPLDLCAVRRWPPKYGERKHQN